MFNLTDSMTDTGFWIYFLAAVLPAFILLRYIYKQDKIEKEPMGLIVKLLFQGVIAGIVASILETIGEEFLPAFADEGTVSYNILLAFIVVALAEEGMKFLLMKKVTWNNPEFNFRFDAIVYAASVSLGFAAFENIAYVFADDGGLSVAALRAIFSIPGHLCFSVFMGYFYGRAKLCNDMGDKRRCKRNLKAAYLSAVFFHGFYDSCAMINSTLSDAVFLVFIVIMYVTVIKLIKKESATDRAV